MHNILSYLYRTATNKDYGEIFKVYREVMETYISRIWGWDEEWQKNDFLSHYKPYDITLVYKLNKLIGYSQLEDKGNVLFMRMLLILPDHRGKGIGTKLLREFITSGNKLSKPPCLEVFKINTQAKAFYTDHGFRVTGETETSYFMKYNTLA